MSACTHIFVCSSIFPALQLFIKSISIKITLTAAGSCSPEGGQTQKNHAVTQPLNHSHFEIYLQDLIFFQYGLGL